jgi:uncharacterized membrane protein
MFITVEPRDGRELDRLITALLNASGLMRRIIEECQRDGLEGLAIIDAAAARVREAVAVMAEHRSDDELAVVTGTLAEMALLMATEMGVGDVFRGR